MVKMEKKLIACVRNRELLYNIKNKDYKRAAAKLEAWKQIGAELNLPPTECKAKWNLLRNAFTHALSRRKPVPGQEPKTFKKWKYEDDIAFLLPFMTNRHSIAATCSENSNDSSDNSEPNEEIEECLINESNHTIDNYHRDMLKIMKSRSRRRPEKNDIDLFFDSIAETVKKFPRLEQVKLKYNIMKMVHEVEMKNCLKTEVQIEFE